MVSSGMKDARYQYVNIDEGWWQGTRDSAGNITAEWPGGMKAIADYIHGKGLKAGIYTDAGRDGCGYYYPTGRPAAPAAAARAITTRTFCSSLNGASTSSRSTGVEGTPKASTPVPDTRRSVRRLIVRPRRPGGRWSCRSATGATSTAGLGASHVHRVAHQRRHHLLGSEPVDGPGAGQLRLGPAPVRPEPRWLQRPRHARRRHAGFLRSSEPHPHGAVGRLWSAAAGRQQSRHDEPRDQGHPGQPGGTRHRPGPPRTTGDEGGRGPRRTPGRSKVLSGTGRRAVLLLNRTTTAAPITAHWSDLGLTGSANVRNPWTGTDAGTLTGGYTTTVQAREAVLITVTASEAGPTPTPTHSAGNAIRGWRRAGVWTSPGPRRPTAPAPLPLPRGRRPHRLERRRPFVSDRSADVRACADRDAEAHAFTSLTRH